MRIGTAFRRHKAVARPPSVPKTRTCTEHSVCSVARQDAHREEVFKDVNYSLYESTKGTIICTSCLFEHPTMQQVHHASADNRPQMCTSRLFENPTKQQVHHASKTTERRRSAIFAVSAHWRALPNQRGNMPYTPSELAESISLSTCLAFPTPALLVTVFLWSKMMMSNLQVEEAKMSVSDTRHGGLDLDTFKHA